jgi:protein-S-isoprenylcysteine O-methyltransferase Ste14
VLDVPVLLLTVTLWGYYAVSVPILVLRGRRRTGRPVGFVPELRRERLMWLVWAPLLLSWMVLPYLALRRRHPLLALPSFAREQPGVVTGRWIAGLGAVLCFVGILACIVRMGESWRVAVVPSQDTPLVTTGPYARVRHPIYGLNLLLMLCSIVVLPTPPMLAIGVVHAILIALKVRSEERFLLAAHGARYAAYRQRTGRFLPRRASRGS